MTGDSPYFRDIAACLRLGTITSHLVCDRVALRAEILVIDPVADKPRLYGIGGRPYLRDIADRSTHGLGA